MRGASPTRSSERLAHLFAKGVPDQVANRFARFGEEEAPVATYLAGEVPHLAAVPPATEQRFVEGSGLSFNTVAPNDFGYWELVHEMLQQNPAGAERFVFVCGW